MWKERAENGWRATLQNIATGECKHFATLEEMFKYLIAAADRPAQESVRRPPELTEYRK
jgi:hypothetical protein